MNTQPAIGVAHHLCINMHLSLHNCHIPLHPQLFLVLLSAPLFDRHPSLRSSGPGLTDLLGWAGAHITASNPYGRRLCLALLHASILHPLTRAPEPSGKTDGCRTRNRYFDRRLKWLSLSVLLALLAAEDTYGAACVCVCHVYVYVYVSNAYVYACVCHVDV